MNVSSLRNQFEGQDTAEIRQLLDEWFSEQIHLRKKLGENVSNITQNDIKDMSEEVRDIRNLHILYLAYLILSHHIYEKNK